MSAHLIYAWNEREAAAISGDPNPELCYDVPCHPDGRIPYLVDDGAIVLDDDEVEYLIDIAGLAATVLIVAAAFSVGYLIGWAR